MNVIVANKRKEDLENSNIDAIKTLYGLFNIDDVVNNFKNYYYSKMIIDCTSIVDFVKPDILKKIANEIGKEKVIILLPNDIEIPINFYRALIDLGIYNFTTEVNEIDDLIQNPNTEDSATEKFLSTEKKQDNDYNNNMNTIDSNSNENDFSNDNNINNNEIYSDNTIKNNESYNNNDTNNENDIFNQNKSSSNNGPIFLQNFDKLTSGNNINNSTNKTIIGIKNITLHAGSTTLIYMLKQILEEKYHKSVLAVEIDENDFVYFQNNSMINTQNNDIETIIKNSNEDIILVDLNDSNYDGICTDVLYLVEPSIIKINRLMVENRKIFELMKNKKVILNMCSLSKNDVEIFAHEAEIPIFFVIPYINDRIINNGLSGLIEKLNLNNNQGNKKSFFN